MGNKIIKTSLRFYASCHTMCNFISVLLKLYSNCNLQWTPAGLREPLGVDPPFKHLRQKGNLTSKVNIENTFSRKGEKLKVIATINSLAILTAFNRCLTHAWRAYFATRID